MGQHSGSAREERKQEEKARGGKNKGTSVGRL